MKFGRKVMSCLLSFALAVSMMCGLFVIDAGATHYPSFSNFTQSYNDSYAVITISFKCSYTNTDNPTKFGISYSTDSSRVLKDKDYNDSPTAFHTSEGYYTILEAKISKLKHGIEPNTLYYYKCYAQYSDGTKIYDNTLRHIYTGNDTSVWTAPHIESISETSITISSTCTYTATKPDSIVACIDRNGTVVKSRTESISFSGQTFTFTFSDLSENTSYSCYYYSVYSSNTIYSASTSFTTPKQSVANNITFYDISASSITEGSVILFARCKYTGTKPSAVYLQMAKNGNSFTTHSKEIAINHNVNPFFVKWGSEENPVKSFGDEYIEPGTTYAYRFFANVGGKTYYSDTFYFTTPAANIASDEVYIYSIGSEYYTGSPLKTTYKLSYHGPNYVEFLEEGKDFTVSFTNNVNAGHGIITFTGKGRFTGTYSTNFTITPAELSDLSTPTIITQIYTGYSITPSITLKYNGMTLVSGTDYTVEYSNNTNAGTATVTATGKGNYTGTLSSNFKIEPRSIANTSIPSIAAQQYTGKAITPSITVKDGTKTLVSGTDYTVAYSNNINVGTAKVTVTGKGNYTDTKTATFTIIDDSGVEINSTNFPDDIFRQYVSDNFDTDSNGKLSENEISKATSINLYNLKTSNISDLKGIEYFTALTWLYCYNNKLTNLDVSKNTALTWLYCDNNQLTSLDLSQNTALTQLSCRGNQLTSLDLSQNTALTQLSCEGNQLTSLDLSQNTALTQLSCNGNQLTSLDLSQNTALTRLWCCENQLTSLDASKNTALIDLNCFNNKIASFDFSKNIALEKLDISHNYITGIDVTKNIALKSFDCSNNALTNLDVSKCVELSTLACGNWLSKNGITSSKYYNAIVSLDVSKNTELTEFYCYDNQLTTLDLSNNIKLERLLCQNNHLTSLDLSKNTALLTVNVKNNKFNIGKVTGSYSLSDLPGKFDASKASNWHSAVYDDATNSITITDRVVTYDYDCGQGETVQFSLAADSISIPIENTSISLEKTSFEYTGAEITPAVIVKDGTKTLVEDTDYTVKYSDNINAGTATVTVTGKGNYADSQKVTFNILPKSIEDAAVADIADQQYTGAAITPAVTVKDGTKTLVEDTDYIVDYKNNVNAGTATVIITGKGNYTGEKTASFTIVKEPDKTMTVEDIPDQEYTGKAITPTLTVKDGDKLLVKGTDYIVTFADNTDVGTATAVVTGIGDYKGLSEVATFKIVAPIPVKELTVEPIPDQEYTGKAITPELTVKDCDKLLVKGTDYIVTFAENTEVGTATAVVTGIGDYKGLSEVVTFKIVKGANPIPEPAGKVVVNDGTKDTAFDDLFTTMKSISTGKGNYVITIEEDLNETKSITMPKNAASLTIEAPDTVTLTLKNSSLTSKCDFALENIILVTNKNKPIGITAKKKLEMTGSSAGALNVTGDLIAAESTVDGKITVKGNAEFSDSTIKRKITASADLTLTDCQSVGAIAVKGVLTITGDGTAAGAISATSKTGVTQLENVTASGNIAAANELVLVNCTVKGNVTSKIALSVGDEVTVSGNVSAPGLSSQDDFAVLSYKTLSVTKSGFTGDNSITLRVIDKNGAPVAMTAGSNKAIAAKTFKGAFDDELVLISEDNCEDAKLSQVKNKLMVIAQ